MNQRRGARLLLDSGFEQINGLEKESGENASAEAGGEMEDFKMPRLVLMLFRQCCFRLTDLRDGDDEWLSLIFGLPSTIVIEAAGMMYQYVSTSDTSGSPQTTASAM